MEFAFSQEQEEFRQEVRRFLKQELPPDWWGLEGIGDAYATHEIWAFHRAFRAKLAARGWLTLSWPTEYGGQGRSVMYQAIFNEEMGFHRAPTIGIGATFVGPALMRHGREDQKRKYLQAISRDEIDFCEGFTEPQAGSDLASLQTRAELRGNEYIINGQKIFTSRAHRADICWLAARTAVNTPPHRGISIFLVDLKSPGITIRPIHDMRGIHYFNEVFYDNVRVPRENLVGQENNGWHMIITTLDFERVIFGAGVGLVGGCRRSLEELVRHIGQTNGRMRRDLKLRHRLAEMAIELEVARLFAYRVAWMHDQGLVSSAAASMAKAYSSEAKQRLASLAMQVLGFYGQLAPESKWVPLRGWVEEMFLYSVSETIGAGTSEIQRNIIAMRGLGLPRN